MGSNMIEPHEILKPDFRSDGDPWFAVLTRSRQEKKVADSLAAVGIVNYLPVMVQMRRWSDRVQAVEFPLFSGYVFVQMDPNPSARIAVLRTRGVVRIIGNHQGPVSIPTQQIESVRTILERGVPCESHAFFNAGDRVRVVRGPLSGVEGTILRNNSASRLFVSIEMIQRSIALNVSSLDVEPVYTSAA